MKKLLALVLVLLMASAALISCGKKDAKENGSFAAIQEGSAEGDIPDIPDDVAFAPEFNILVAGNMARNDFEAEDDNGTTVETAIYRRNQLMYDTYGVEILNEDITKFIIGAIGDASPLTTPKLKGTLATMRYLRGESYEDLEKTRRQMLDTSSDDLMRIADVIDGISKADAICVVGGKDKLSTCKGLESLIEI